MSCVLLGMGGGRVGGSKESNSVIKFLECMAVGSSFSEEVSLSKKGLMGLDFSDDDIGEEEGMENDSFMVLGIN